MFTNLVSLITLFGSSLLLGPPCAANTKHAHGRILQQCPGHSPMGCSPTVSN